MIRVDRNRIEVPSVFSSEKIKIARDRIEIFYKSSEHSRSQQRFQRPFEQDLTKEILEGLRYLFNNKCAYCESLIDFSSRGVIDHFRPKNGARGLDDEFSNDHYWWLTYEWKNLNLACDSCNRFKSTWFPVNGERSIINTEYSRVIEIEDAYLVDPCNDMPEKHLVFNHSGKADFLTQKGRLTIEILKLNREELVHAREKALMEEFSDWEEFLKKWRNQEDNWQRIQQIAKKWEAILDNTSLLSFLAARKMLLNDRFEQHPDIKNFFGNKLFDFNKKTRRLFFDGPTAPVVSKYSLPLAKKEKKAIESEIDLTKLKHVYLDRIELKNYKCFSFINLTLNENVRPNIISESESKIPKEPWRLFLGENGVGKSSIIKAIAIALMSSQYRSKIRNHIHPDKLLKHGEDDGYIKLYLKGEEKPIEVKFRKGDDKISCTNSKSKINLVAYGATRLMPTSKIKPEKVRNEAIKAQNLFDYSVALEDSEQWLNSLTDEKFNTAAKTLKDLMALRNEDTIIRDLATHGIYISTSSGQPIPIHDLSDGYKAVYSIAVDIMATLSNKKVSYEVSEAIVLIDEIGTHLHPRWKMEVVTQLRNAFPRIQFIVTTHEPLCLRGLRANETVVLNRDENKEILALTDLPDPSNLRIDQILTSDFFGLQSTMDSQTEKIFDEYYALLAKDEEQRSENEKSRIIELSNIVPKIKNLGDTLREDIIYYVVDELLAKNVKTQGYEMRNDLKEEAVARVKSLWESLNLDNIES